jgi:MFS family permease
MSAERRNLFVLASCQALTLASNSTVFTVSVLAGRELAGDKSLSTLPMTTSVIGTALATLPMSLLMRRIGRRAGFTVGALTGAAGVALALAALYAHSFPLLCVGMWLFGVHGAAAQYYRFAAADATSTEGRSSAISLVLAGGVVGGLVGPEVSKWSVGLLDVRFAGAYAFVLLYLAMIAGVMAALRLPPVGEDHANGTGRPLSVVAAQPAFIVAALGAAIGWGVMNLLMIATPLAMSCCHSYDSAAFVIQWHIVAMFAPSFFTGNLVKRAGALTVMFAGVVMQLVCVAIALSGTDVAHFWVALVLLGVGWNFLFVGSTTLLTETYAPTERAKSQGLNELLVSTTLIFSSATSGWLVARDGWAGPNHVAAPLVLVAGVAILWLMARKRAEVAEAA